MFDKDTQYLRHIKINLTLPYKIDDEQPAEWRQMLYEKYNPLLDSLRNTPDASDPYKAAYTIIQYLCGEEKYFTALLPDLPHIGPHILDQWRAGSCRDIADLTVYILRALGIACGVDFSPILSSDNTGHLWTFVLDKSGQAYTSDCLDCKILHSEEVKIHSPKLYRKTFSVNRKMEAQMQALDPVVPNFFVNPKMIDVTSLYTNGFPIYPVVIPDSELYQQEQIGKIAYLCVPRKQGWLPVAWAKFDKQGIRFDGVKSRTAFRVATLQNNNFVFQTGPFIIDTLGILHSMRAVSEKQQVCLFSKFNPGVEHFTGRMKGGVFEGSNQNNFYPSDTLFVIEDEPLRMLNKVWVFSEKKYRYVRYKGIDGSYCDVADVAFFENADDTISLFGRPIGTPNLLGENDRNDYINALDGNHTTSFHYREPNGGWVGLELKHPVRISSIVYTPRNRDNFVRKGDSYELFHLDREWVSHGIQTALSDSLIYDDVPSGTILYLKGHTRGVEERPFLYDDGKQLWWWK